MNPELKAKWVEALRSGKYEQGTGHLRVNDAFCCLGVLCDIFEPSEWRLHSENVYQYMGNTGHMPLALISDDDQERLVDMNDKGKSFSEIADWIEANVEATDKTSSPGT